MDFRAGLIALGRDWYAKAAQSPDSLADHPTVIKGVGSYGDGELRCQWICATGVVGNSLEKSGTGTERSLPMHSLY
ncbi:DUF4240 domain-containing protein [Streptomyces sp. NPDC002187]|uniref:DUF4240 domain-containing protein n=1 Tax=Streptomyces sp. NPDC002187 TaxID=3364637 RepID=UPI0036C080FD